MSNHKIRVMVVDDQPALARVVRLVLERTERYEVLLETRPGQVLGVARGFRPAAILLDVDMPGKNGAEVARDLWQEADLNHIPILFFSGLVPTKESGMRETAHGAMRFVSKFAQPPELIAAIEEILAAGSEAPCISVDEVRPESFVA